MADENQELEQKPPVKWATPIQRVWAWVGVIYMVILVLLSTYGLAHGFFLSGIGGIMVSPALCGLGATAVLRFRQGQGRGGMRHGQRGLLCSGGVEPGSERPHFTGTAMR